MAKIQVLGTGCSKCGYLLKNAETWLRRITGGSILAVGIYITIQQVYLSEARRQE
jgi:hypothetical protein